jgi:hypothetical protein
MAVHSPLTPPAPRSTSGARRRASFTVTGWVLGVLGALATFLGAFILLAADDQSVGLGGQASWQVGEIDPAWGYGLLTAGVLALLAALALVLRARSLPPLPEAERGSGWGDVAAHAGIFVVVNTFLWAQDVALGDGLNYAYWVTIPWGIGLAAHALSQYRATHRSPLPTQ